MPSQSKMKLKTKKTSGMFESLAWVSSKLLKVTDAEARSQQLLHLIMWWSRLRPWWCSCTQCSHQARSRRSPCAKERRRPQCRANRIWKRETASFVSLCQVFLYPSIYWPNVTHGGLVACIEVGSPEISNLIWAQINQKAKICQNYFDFSDLPSWEKWWLDVAINSPFIIWS